MNLLIILKSFKYTYIFILKNSQNIQKYALKIPKNIFIKKTLKLIVKNDLLK